MKFLTPLEFSKTFRRSRKTVYRWLREGKVIDSSAVLRIQGGVLIPKSEVQRIIKNGTFRTR